MWSMLFPMKAAACVCARVHVHVVHVHVVHVQLVHVDVQPPTAYGPYRASQHLPRS